MICLALSVFMLLIMSVVIINVVVDWGWLLGWFCPSVAVVECEEFKVKRHSKIYEIVNFSR